MTHPRATCPTCHTSMARHILPRHQAIPHTEQCPICLLHFPAPRPGPNPTSITIRSHMRNAHGTTLRTYLARQKRAARAAQTRTTKTVQPRTTPTPKAQSKPKAPAPRLTPLERRRNALAGAIRRMADGPKKQAARLRLVGVAWAAWRERQGVTP